MSTNQEDVSKNGTFSPELKEKINTLENLMKQREKQLKATHDSPVETEEDDELGLPGYTGIF